MPFWSSSFLERPAWSVYDLFQEGTLLQNPEGVALIMVNQDSLDAFEKNEGLTFPFPRQIYGALATVARAAKAKAIAFDILFTEASPHGVDDDRLFAELLNQSQLPIFMPAGSQKGKVKPPISILRSEVAKLHLAGIHMPSENDSVLRRSPSTLPGEKGPVPTLSQAIFKTVFPALAATKKDDHSELIHFYDPMQFPRISLYNILIGYRALQEGRALPKNFQALKDRVWLVGYTAPGLHDIKAIPIDVQAPGYLIHANALSNQLDGRGLTAVSPTSLALIAFLLSLCGFFLISKIHTPREGIGALILFLFTSSFGGSFLFWSYDQWLNPLTLFFAVAWPCVGGLALKYQTQWKERLKLAKSLEHSMSKEMVDLIRSGNVQISRYGEEKTITVFFCDLAGFTTLSEQMGAKDLVELLNEYLDRVVDLIVDQKGYVDKFIGDAVMAFWGAPVPEEKHAQLGIEAAAALNQMVEKFNLDMQKAYGKKTDFQARVGLHTGIAVVGNIGAQSRYNYTAIGDTVNLAARLEGLGKKYDCTFLMSEDCVQNARMEKSENILELDQVVVKGRSQATRIYTSITSAQKEQAATYRTALDSYYRALWQEALEGFKQCSTLPSAKIMAARCQAALDSGTPKAWSKGAWVHDSK